MKKVLVLSLALILLLGITGHGTSSYFSDTETSTGNTFTAWVEECVCYGFNVSDFKGNDRRIFTYDVPDSSASFIGFFDLDADNGHPSGVASFADSIYVLDQSDKQVYQYDCCGTLLEVSGELLPSAGNSIANPVGLAIDGDELWVVSANDKMIYLYSLSAAFSGSGDPVRSDGNREITLVDANTGAAGLAIDSTYLYVVDYDNPSKETRFYRYLKADGSVTVSKVLLEKNTNNELQSPAGAMFDGTSLWVVDSGTNKAYRYDNVASLFPGDSNTVKADWEFDLDSNNSNATGV